MNEIILDEAPLEIKRFFSLDNQMYKDGALDVKTKELMGLVASIKSNSAALLRTR